ncbi:MAG: hypothetical protein EAZ78_26295 [Oscillatoriales cyanobacterium]|nr:MAG: hypothetical protein EA000_22850 [Oscillatoriales cyanobacterium]TAD94218.1 MAG: hypothetical protein EAZ98_20050 [Oscillatoriales cyanobacterium]TAD97689.1 MAG: hypothetical protein EAZ96_24890 [Oscillatoriales cyanobacterium]TAE97007.1 MAG: hypothetical protein EAZ78_26295 [Oscillatoriales cyanobacterium]TAF59157.1 MAG: hypothetical protein EAZ59_28035 [Oscillatoriales cyanobacterium]
MKTKQNNQQRATANKIKKWSQTSKKVEKTLFAIPITRLTSIKSLCTDEVAAENFALYRTHLTSITVATSQMPNRFQLFYYPNHLISRLVAVE